MTRRATIRLPVAAVATAAGALAAVLAGSPEAALLVAPWMVLLVFGLTGSANGAAAVAVEVAPERLLVGDEVEVTTSVSGASGSLRVTCLPSSGFWASEADSDDHESARLVDVLSAGSAVVRRSLPALQWGTHSVGDVAVEITEPFGLFRRETQASRPAQLRVHPSPVDIQNLLAPFLVRRITGAHSSRVVGRGVEFADIRPYTSGDSLRDINWRASARSIDLWVSQRHSDQATDVILLLDSFVESGHDVHTVVGLSIEAAVALAENHLGVTDRVGLVDLGGVVRWVTPGTGRLQLQRLIDSLLSTGLYTNAAYRDLHVPVRVLPPRSFVVALTPLLDGRFIDALFVLAGRGHDVAVIECDAAPMDVGDSHTTDSARLVHRFWQADRQVVRDRLAEHGIAVAQWQRGRHLDLALNELARRRHRPVRGGRR